MTSEYPWCTASWNFRSHGWIIIIIIIILYLYSAISNPFQKSNGKMLEIKASIEKQTNKFWKSKTHLRNQTEKFWKSKNHFRNQMEKFWKSKKLLKKSNGQILEIKNSFQKLINWANFGNQKFISEIKRTNFEIKNSCTLEIMRTDFGNQKIVSAINRRNFGNHWKNPVIHVNQADNQRIKANNYFSDAPRTPWTMANWDISAGEMIRAIDETTS